MKKQVKKDEVFFAGTNFEHRGQKIEFTARGVFHAKVNGRNQTAASLAAIKRRIDKQLKETMKPFYAYNVNTYYKRLEKIKIVRIEKAQRHRGKKPELCFIDSAGRFHLEVYKASERKKLQAYIDYEKETGRIEEQRKKTAKGLLDKAKLLSARSVAGDDLL